MKQKKLGTVQENKIRSTDHVRRIIAPVGEQGRRYGVIFLCPRCISFPLEDYVWWVSEGKGRNNWWCAICGEKYDWKQPNRLLVVQTGESINQAKVFKAYAVPQGLCGNLINALKLLTNQQEDGQNIVTGHTGAERTYTSRTLERRFGDLSKYEGRKDRKDSQR